MTRDTRSRLCSIGILACIAVLLLVLAGCGDDIAISKPVGADGGGNPGVYLFRSPGTAIGNLGGRSGADAFVGSGPAVCAGKTAHAFLSVSGSDSISQMPANYGVPTNVPVKGDTGNPLATDWADLLDGLILNRMQVAVSGLGSTDQYWTGSDQFGDPVSTCTNWTIGTKGIFGTAGQANQVGGGWLDFVGLDCDTPIYVIGICY